MLSKISIEGFKSIERLQQFKLQNVNVLIGANGSGKSNFIEAFRMVNRIMEERLQLYIGQNGGLSKLLHFGPKRTSEMNFALDFDANGYEFSLTQAQSDSGVFSKEVAWFHDKSKYPTPYKDHLRAGHRETALTLHAQKPGIAKHVLNWIRSWRLYHFHDTSPSSKIKQLQAMDDNAVLREDASNLAPFLFFLRMRHPGHYENIVSTIRQVAPFFRDFALRESPFSPGRMKLEWLEAGSDEYMDASALSDGTLRFICIVVLFLQPFPPDTILLDEPELGLHPYAITLLSELFLSASASRQVIVSTQSTTLINQMKPANIIVVERHYGASHFKRLPRQALEECHHFNEWLSRMETAIS